VMKAFDARRRHLFEFLNRALLQGSISRRGLVHAYASGLDDGRWDGCARAVRREIRSTGWCDRAVPVDAA